MAARSASVIDRPLAGVRTAPDETVPTITHCAPLSDNDESPVTRDVVQGHRAVRSSNHSTVMVNVVGAPTPLVEPKNCTVTSAVPAATAFPPALVV